jgi:hypothetical protein
MLAICYNQSFIIELCNLSYTHRSTLGLFINGLVEKVADLNVMHGVDNGKKDLAK